MSQKHKLRRYEVDRIDFIIPFLVNQSSDRTRSPAAKRSSIPCLSKDSNDNDLDKIAKIYNIKPKKSIKRQLMFSKSISKDQASAATDRKQLALTQISDSKPRPLHRFIKVQSQVSHPLYNCSPNRESSERQIAYTKKKTKKQEDDSPILGVKFKKSKDFFRNYNSQLIEGLEQEEPIVDNLRGDIKKKVAYMKREKEWGKIRGMNVDQIINRRCKNFDELITEYAKRMEIQQGSKIFVFDSKDLWMKRVLLARGWVENKNLNSRAFNLHWGNKIYKGPLYESQRSNHYPNSYSLTTKAGLHCLLRQYNLTHLQPITFDLSSEKDLFLAEYHKIRFFSLLQTLLQKFEFEDPVFNLSSSQILQEIHSLIAKGQQAQPEVSLRQKEIIQILTYSQAILQNNFKEFDSQIVQRVGKAITAKLPLNETEEEAIRILRDFESCISRQSIIRDSITVGTSNFWLTKSLVSSKGAGITLHNDLNSILKHQNRLVQKYIERPLILERSPFNGRKFDLRVWVLLVGSSPEIYYHRQFYGRVCFDGYSLDPADIKQDSIHLTNYTVNKKDFRKSSELAQSIILPDTLFKAVKDTLGFDYRTKFYQDFERLLKKLGQALSKEVAGKETSNCLELFGFDILVDASLHMHLLEVNLSAACQQRHPKLTEMLEEMAHGIVNLLEGHEQSSLDLHGWKRLQ